MQRLRRIPSPAGRIGEHRTLPDRSGRIEPRWPYILTLVVALFLLAALPQRVRLFPGWFPYVIGFIGLAPTLAVVFASDTPRLLRLERLAILLFVAITTVCNVANLANLVEALIHRSADLSGVQLLASSIAIWIGNVFVFSVAYWQVDRGGPEARIAAADRKPDWSFQQEALPDQVRPGWRPGFIDYFFLGYSTATAFSPTAALPLTSRAMVLMMLESTISLTTVVVVAARAVNILGS